MEGFQTPFGKKKKKKSKYSKKRKTKKEKEKKKRKKINLGQGLFQNIKKKRKGNRIIPISCNFSDFVELLIKIN